MDGEEKERGTKCAANKRWLPGVIYALHHRQTVCAAMIRAATGAAHDNFALTQFKREDNVAK